MKKFVALGIGCCTLLLMVMLLTVALLHTRYLTPSAQWLTARLWPEFFTFSQVEYHYPLHFRFSNPTIMLDKKTLPLQQLDIWLNPRFIKHGKWQVDSLLIDGGNFASGLPDYPLPTQWEIAHLALHNIDFAHHGLIARGVNVQIHRPLWLEKEQWLPYGEIQLSAEQFYWQGEAINSLLIDANYQPQDSTLYGASFEWNGAQISGQAEQYSTGWSLINTTISQLNVTEKTVDSLHSWWPMIEPYLQHINSLDVLQSHLSFHDIVMENISLSIENVNLHYSVWQQEGADLSLNADKIEWQQLAWIEPALQLTLAQQQATIHSFNSQLLQGYVHFAGRFSPTHLNVDQLTLSGIKWLDEPVPTLTWPTIFNQIQGITFNQLRAHNLQIIQLTTPPVWQLSGLNIEGHQLEVMKQGHWGLWNGQLNLSANSASVADLIATQGIIEMQSQQGDWQLKRAFFPLAQGYIDLVAGWNFTQPSAPWYIDLHTDSLSLKPLNAWLTLPFKVEALADIELRLRGLTRDYAMLSHSLTGDMQASLHSGLLSFQQHDTLTIQPFQLDDLRLQADRGRITLPESTLQGPALSATLSGTLDLLTPQQGKLELNLMQKCQHILFDLWRNQQQNKVDHRCSIIQ
ncbi:AsmA family protein [Vibrio cincinnatiensis]|uniref:AsmA family protein n=1 Tax=Vibrio cincinnatiensis TaxID=675 RepID=UPI001EDEF5E0|nr:AsmA family protein [Vibrio cincinnatiensis]MCG3736413.1 AsmA family protein [Vibrio cincinnatiensis]